MSVGTNRVGSRDWISATKGLKIFAYMPNQEDQSRSFVAVGQAIEIAWEPELIGTPEPKSYSLLVST